MISIFGFGASSDIPLAMAEEGRFEQGKILEYHFTTEHGTERRSSRTRRRAPRALLIPIAEERAGRGIEDRLYPSVRQARRDLAIALLTDISGSTDGWVSNDLRIIDVEKEALLIVCHALDALGDPYTIQAFSGEGPDDVALWPVKDFDERVSAPVHARVYAQTLADSCCSLSTGRWCSSNRT